MNILKLDDLRGLYRFPHDSHKGQNGRLLVIGGSELFHASIFWAADVASRVVDLVHFSSPAIENNELVHKKAKDGFWNGIVVPWEKVEEYIQEDDCIVIGPGMVRREAARKMENGKLIIDNDDDLKKAALLDRTDLITNYLLRKYPHKKWVIDGGALQEVDVNLIPKNAILTPHHKEWEGLLTRSDLVDKQQSPTFFAKKHECVVVVKGVKDIVCCADECREIEGGNEGMTKGGTGDVLAGLIGALYCKNDSWLAATVGSYINKKAGDNLYERVGPYFNSSDLVDEIPVVMKEVWGY